MASSSSSCSSSESGSMDAAVAVTPALDAPVAVPEEEKEEVKVVSDSEDEVSPNFKANQPIFWTEDDEVAILNNMLVFYRQKNVLPTSKTHLHDFFLQIGHLFKSKKLKETQLRGKIKKLKDRYRRNRHKPVNRKWFELANEIWGDAAEPPRLAAPPPQSTHCVNELRSSGHCNDLLLEGLNKANGERRASLEAQWETLLFAELQLRLERSMLLGKTIRLSLDFIKKSGK